MQIINGCHELRPIETVLARLDLCEGVAAQTLRALALQARMRRAPRGQAIVLRGERPASAFAVIHGALKARLQHADGDEAILALLGPGESFGKAASIFAHPSKVDVVTLEETLLLEIGAAALSAQMTRDPRLARNLANCLAAKAQALVDELEQSKLPTLRRLVAYLESLAEPTAAPHVWTARLPVSKTVVAARLGMKKETLSRLLQRLARRGLIEVTRRNITILDRAALVQASSSPMRAA